MTPVAIALCLLTAPTAPIDLEPGDLKPGLVAEYRSIAEPTARVARVEPKPAFTLGRSSPHPRIPPGPFEVTYTGVLQIKERGGITFSAFVGGELIVTVDGVTVLEGRGQTATAQLKGKIPLKRDPGHYTFVAKYRSLTDVPARLQIWWEGEEFAREPLPAWRLRHVDREIDKQPQLFVLLDKQAADGRNLVGEYGCARCHASALPAITDPPPGPSLADANRRLGKPWLMQWLADPGKVRPDAHMPALFSNDRAGFVERWIVAESLTAGAGKREEAPAGDHRRGRLAFVSTGCATCHLVPDVDPNEQKSHGRRSFAGLADRMSAADIAIFLGNPHSRYPDGRMPRLPVTPAEARDIAAYLLLWSKPTEVPVVESPKPEELQAAYKKLGTRDQSSAAGMLLKEKGCTACHTGLGESRPRDVPIKDPRSPTCFGEKSGVRYTTVIVGKWPELAMRHYLRQVAAQEKYPSPFADRQRKLERAGCTKCHQRDSDRAPPIEEIGSTLGGAFLQETPFLRTPRLTHAHQKYTRAHLASSVREGVSDLRGARFTYRMPAFGADADVLLQALAEADGELPGEADAAEPAVADPTLGTLHGAQLTGFQGYSCVSCHVWNGKLIGSPDPAATGPDLTRTAGRIRRDWFDRYLESPLRFHPGTPMPSSFPHGKPAVLANVLGGDPAKQKDALWAYLAKGKDVPGPGTPPAVPVAPPAADEGVLVAQIPIRLPDGKAVEAICILSADHDLLVYDLGVGPVALFTGGQITRNVQGRIRQFFATGTAVELKAAALSELSARGKPKAISLLGYDRLAVGARLRWQFDFGKDSVELTETLRFVTEKGTRQLVREIRSSGEVDPLVFKHDLPAVKAPLAWANKPLTFPDDPEGLLERPGYKAIAYPRPKTVSGEDRVMPGAVAVRPKDGKVFVASLKTGELFTLRNPDDAKKATFELYGRGLYQDAHSMLAEGDGLYVLHRRNLTKIVERAGVPDRVDRVFALPQGVADTYDMAYGLARDKSGAFVLSFAPYGDAKTPGAGSAIRMKPGKPVEEVAFGMRNPLGWCNGPNGEVFFTDNQGDWVASNKLCHLSEGKFYGWPNRAQPQHITKPAGKTTVWVPYAWARSINGMTFDNTGGKFGPFAGQFFMAELMYGGAIVRANVEEVNGVYQGACFPFWGKGLLGPVCLAFDPRGALYVGGITEPGWMAQPDRGALYRIDFTGKVPFEMQSIHVRPRGFRIVFTAPVDKAKAADIASYKLESYRYEYTGAYGSPELDRATVKVEKAEVSADGKSVELTTAALVKDRVYLMSVPGVLSATGEAPLHPTGAYTINEIPGK